MLCTRIVTFPDFINNCSYNMCVGGGHECVHFLVSSKQFKDKEQPKIFEN